MRSNQYRAKEFQVSRGAESCCDRHHGKTRASRVAAAMLQGVTNTPSDAAALWLPPSIPSDFLRGRVPAGDAALHGAARQTVQAESPRGLASAVEARNNIAVKVYHLALRVDPETGARVVDDGRGPSGMERRRLNLKFWRGLSEVGILARVHKRVVPRNGILQRIGRHRLSLIFVRDFPSQFRDCACGEEIPLRSIHKGRCNRPTLALHRV